MNPVEEQHIAELKVIGLLHDIDKLTAERDRMRAALSAIAKGWVIETVATQALARQALGDTE